MAHRSDPELLVLHTLRLKGFVDADVVAFTSRQPEHVVHEILARLRDAGLVVRRDGRITGWSLTAEGRSEGERRLAAELDDANCRSLVVDAYGQFLALNDPFLTACTRWQLRDDHEGVRTNEHDDPAYDASVVAELDRLDDAVQPLCSGLAAVLERFSYYNGRFAVARLRVHDGEHDWFTRSMIDSYHAVWFELHENLLATLNIARGSEAARAMALSTENDKESTEADVADGGIVIGRDEADKASTEADVADGGIVIGRDEADRASTGGR